MEEKLTTRRKVLIGMTAAVGAAGVPFAATPFISSMNPSAKAKAFGAPVKVDISKIQIGQKIQVAWRKQPVFVIRHSKEALKNLSKVISKLDDPNSEKIDEPYRAMNPTRSTSDEYTVIAGVCTHLGCSPKYFPDIEPQPWDQSWVGGFFCPCHGSMFDIVGRVFKGVPAPTNLKVPPHYFDGKILTIGEDKGTA
jgi:ubiquinol-cytochrome c reductase iron-sulfur subunit